MGLDITFSRNDVNKGEKIKVYTVPEKKLITEGEHYDLFPPLEVKEINKESWHGTPILQFRKRYDILGSVVFLDSNCCYDSEEDAANFESCSGGEKLLNKGEIEYLISRYEELKPLKDYDEVICWWVS